MTEEEKEKIINTFNNAWSRKIASENSHGKLASKEMFENKEEIISGIQDDGHTVRFNQHLFDHSTIKIYQDEIARLEQERDEIQERILTLADTYQETRNVCKRLEQENKQMKSVLEEIKRMLTSPYPGQPRDVLNVINEVLQ